MIEHIVSTTPPSRLFELYYWAQEPDLLKLIRRLATLSPANRGAIESFFDLVADNASITAKWGARGQLILDAKHLGDTASMFRYMLEDDKPDPDGSKPN